MRYISTHIGRDSMDTAHDWRTLRRTTEAVERIVAVKVISTE